MTHQSFFSLIINSIDFRQEGAGQGESINCMNNIQYSYFANNIHKYLNTKKVSYETSGNFRVGLM